MTMQAEARQDAWTAGDSYERYMGRWSRQIAERFLDWLDPPAGADWVEVGCGTGALTSEILRRALPRSILATDPAGGFVIHTRNALRDPRARFQQAVADQLPTASSSADLLVSGLVLNFVPDRAAALAEARGVLRPGGQLAFYVWDYPGGGLGFVDAFWKEAAKLDPAAGVLDEAVRFPFCRPRVLAEMCTQAGFAEPNVVPIEITAEFPDFDAYWTPFTLGTGPAPGYCLGLSPELRSSLRTRLKERLESDGPIRLTARAWAVRARNPT
ncbi:class I SAM-dependent methyltransferase [Frigidibacter sp. MR17.24]|uniref:class I SAM-dependent methyltransferase n=1 Tax=Frigidibacter sp. MR17.24 TaxID=3127345 RepID=UPI003012E48E